MQWLAARARAALNATESLSWQEGYKMTNAESARLTVHSHGRSIEIALDGEVRRLASPLEFLVDSGALMIVVPDER